MPGMKKDEISTTEAAELLGCSKRTINRMIERGTLHARKLDPTAKSVFRISRADVEALRGTTTTPTKRKAKAKR